MERSDKSLPLTAAGGSPGTIFKALTACALLLTIFVTTSWRAVSTKCATYDEPLHLVAAWIQTNEHDFRYDPEDPALWKYFAIAGIPADRLKIDHNNPAWYTTLHDKTISDTLAADVLYRTPGNNADRLIQAARSRMIVVGALLGATIAIISWRLRGPLAAVIATAAFSLDPNFLAHSPLIKNDVPVTLIFLWLMAAIWLLGRRVTLVRCLSAGVLLGIALTTKFSAFLAIPVLGLALIVRALAPARWPVLGSIAQKTPQRIIAAVAIGFSAIFMAYCIIWASYQFRFRNGPDANTIVDLSDIQTICAISQSIRDHHVAWDETIPQDQVRKWIAEWHPDAVVRSTLWLNAHRILPQAYLRGFLYTYASTSYRCTFLCGQLSLTGWWYYFPLAFLFKTPLATLIAIVLAGIVSLKAVKKSNPWTFFSLAIFPVFYMAFSIHSDFDIGLRHIFPIYPFLFILIGVAAADFHDRRPRATVWILSILLAGLVMETYFAYPDFIPFFNTAVGGARGGADLLGDSNLDWGQDLPALADWQRDHPRTQLYLCYFGAPDPRIYGIHYVNFAGSSAPADQKQGENLPPVFAFSVTSIQGIYLTPEQHKGYEQLLQNRKLITSLGGSIYLFDGLNR